MVTLEKRKIWLLCKGAIGLTILDTKFPFFNPNKQTFLFNLLLKKELENQKWPVIRTVLACRVFLV